MVDSILVAATTSAFIELLNEKGAAYVIDENSAYAGYMELWDRCDDQESMMRQTRPAIRRISEKEPYIFLKDGGPIYLRFNDIKRSLNRESFGEILLERPDKDWRISVSVKNDARVIATLPLADRAAATYEDKVVNVYNKIDDFGDRVLGIPCSNEYFEDINAILERIEPRDRQTWRELLADDHFAYDIMITPMLKAIGEEMKRLCFRHPEAPQKLLDYFYGKIDYYYIHPIDEVKVTRIGSINPRGQLGRIPGNTNLYIPSVEFPTELLDVRFANGRYGELSRDTIQFTFNGGWSVCITIMVCKDQGDGSDFELNVYLPVTPFGSYRDQVAWDMQ